MSFQTQEQQWLVTHDFIPFGFSSDSSQLKNDDDIFMTVSSLILVILPNLISQDFQLMKKQNSINLKLSFNLETYDYLKQKSAKPFNVSKTSKFVIFHSSYETKSLFLHIPFFLVIYKIPKNFFFIYLREKFQSNCKMCYYVHNSFNLSSMKVKFPRLIHSFRVV